MVTMKSLFRASGEGAVLASKEGAGLDRLSRRGFLGGAAAIGANALVTGRSAAQTAASANPRRIDFHHHFQAPEILALASAKGQRQVTVSWTLSKALEDMDKGGTATTLLSAFGQPAVLDADLETARKASRLANEYVAKLRSDYPGRFGSFAELPLVLGDTEGCLREIGYALDTLKADGVATYTSYGDKYVGDENWIPLCEELNRRKAVVFVHPHSPSCCDAIAKAVPRTVIEYGADTTRVIANLIFSGVTSRFPDITWIFSHGGGMMPYVIERFLNGTAAEVVPGIVTKGQGGTGVVGSNPRQNVVPKGVLYELRKMYYDTAQSSNPVAMGALRKVVPVSQIVYGTDYWFRTAEETGRGLITNRVFNEPELRAINRGNAERLFPRYRA